jgi:single-stranded-DNA-specific exonuclease
MVRKRLANVDLELKIYSDGKLSENDISIEFAALLQNAGTWGQEFPEPVFDGIFDVIQSRIVGQRHLKLVLRKPDTEQLIDAIAFYVDHPEQWLGLRSCRIVYKLDINEFRGNRSVQFILQYMEKIA